jgi:hypothetical protein
MLKQQESEPSYDVSKVEASNLLVSGSDLLISEGCKNVKNNTRGFMRRSERPRKKGARELSKDQGNQNGLIHIMSVLPFMNNRLNLFHMVRIG